MLVDSFVGSFFSAGTILTVIGLLLKIFPSFERHMANSFGAMIEFDKLPEKSDLRKHVDSAAKLDKKIDRLESKVNDVLEDSSQNAILALMASPYDQSPHVEEELKKLNDLGSERFVVHLAEEYLKDPYGYIHRHKIQERKVEQ